VRLFAHTRLLAVGAPVSPRGSFRRVA